MKPFRFVHRPCPCRDRTTRRTMSHDNTVCLRDPRTVEITRRTGSDFVSSGRGLVCGGARGTFPVIASDGTDKIGTMIIHDVTNACAKRTPSGRAARGTTSCATRISAGQERGTPKTRRLINRLRTK